MSDNTLGRYFEAALHNGNHDASLSNPAQQFASGHMPLQDAGYQALSVYFRRLQKALAVLDRIKDADTIHEARVAVRGLRAMIQLLEPAPGFQRKRLRRFSRGLKGLARVLGTVRDMDVLLEHLHAYAVQHEAAGEGLRRLQGQLSKRRKAAAKEVHAVLERQQMRRVMKELGKEIRHPHQAGRSNNQYPLLVRHFAGSAIWQRYQEILSYELKLTDASGETLHALRIACKRLRYSMQIFGQTPESAEEILAALKTAQDDLGHLHDVLFAEQIIRGLLPLSTLTPDFDYVNHINYADYIEYVDSLEVEADHLAASIGPIWERLTGWQMRQTIASFIASL